MRFSNELNLLRRFDAFRSDREMEIDPKTKGELAQVNIDILSVPNIRYIRNVAVSNLDLVVTIGGVGGLFFGASLLSVLEFCYIWLIRKF